MATISTQKSQKFVGAYTPRGLCQIVGLVCIVGFVIDILAIAFPPAFGAIEWRVGFFQQLGDRSIILLFGLALIIYSNLDNRTWRKYLVTTCLILGIAFILSSILAIRDGLSLQERTLQQISTQASQFQSQIQDAQTNPKGNTKVTPEQLEKASQLLTKQANSLKENAKTGVLKTSVSTVGNLIVIGLGLLGLGQYGARPSRE